MNRIKTTLFLLMLIACATAFSQINKSVSYLAGYSEEGFANQINLQLYPGQVSESFYEIGIYTGFLKETKTKYNLELNVYSLNAGYHFRLRPVSATNNKIVTTLGFGGIIGLEKLNEGNKDLEDGALILSEDGLIYGGYGAIETDFYLSKNWSLIGKYTHYYHVNSDVGQSKFMAGIGLKYIFI